MESVLFISKPLVQATYTDYTGMLEGDGTFYILPGKYPAKMVGRNAYIILSKSQGFKPRRLRKLVGESALQHAYTCDCDYNSGDDLNQSHTQRAFNALSEEMTDADLLKWHEEIITNFHCN